MVDEVELQRWEQKKDEDENETGSIFTVRGRAGLSAVSSASEWIVSKERSVQSCDEECNDYQGLDLYGSVKKVLVFLT